VGRSDFWRFTVSWGICSESDDICYVRFTIASFETARSTPGTWSLWAEKLILSATASPSALRRRQVDRTLTTPRSTPLTARRQAVSVAAKSSPMRPVKGN
jgi:hypothetical protein